jgi:hypothetical protein
MRVFLTSSTKSSLSLKPIHYFYPKTNQRMKVFFKIAGGLVAVLLILFTGAYLLYNEPLPQGTSGPAADQLGQKMMSAVGSENLDNTALLSWTFAGSHHYVWDRKRNLVEVAWGDTQVLLNLDSWEKGRAYEDGKEVTDSGELDKKRGKAWEFFVNDSFWFIAPTKAFDEGVKRSLVKQKDGTEALLVTYTSGGVTPGDSYLWLLDDKGLPYAFKLWVSIIPIGGIKATWSDWKTLKSGLKVATVHKLGPVPLTFSETKSAASFEELGRLGDPFAAIL